MKRLHFLLPMVLLAMLSLTLSSCEIEPGDPYFARYEWWDDSYRNPDRMLVDMARALRGRWQGTLVAKGLDGYGRLYRRVILPKLSLISILLWLFTDAVFSRIIEVSTTRTPIHGVFHGISTAEPAIYISITITTTR
ncbi:hypothetical protein [Hoylesella saccharolytica]|uniref:hypothetical protein n=1 Tax=Hoylesella saccharolytica TaxID=633701 RepID=UPI001F20B488|nr:hypothetical protein [Hoylesella saccharolytica]